MTGYVGTLPIRKGDPLHYQLTTLAAAQCNCYLVCRLGFAYDTEVEIHRVQADIRRMQQQLQMFDNHTIVPSAYAQKHAIDPNSPAHPIQDIVVPAPATLKPFLFVGVLSVARNAGVPECVPSRVTLKQPDHGLCISYAIVDIHSDTLHPICHHIYHA